MRIMSFYENLVLQTQMNDSRYRSVYGAGKTPVKISQRKPMSYEEQIRELARRVMKDLKAIMGEKPYFVVTSNGECHFELCGFAPEKIYEVEVDSGFIRKGEGQRRFQAFLEEYHGKRLVVLELGIGPRNQLIKAPLMRLVDREPYGTYLTVNLGEALGRLRVMCEF